MRDSPNLEGQVPVVISHRNRVAQLYTQALGSLFVAYDSQGYDGGIRNPPPHGILIQSIFFVLFISPRHGPRRKHRLSAVEKACLQPCCIAKKLFDCCLRIRCRGDVFNEQMPSNGVCSDSTIPAFGRHVTTFCKLQSAYTYRSLWCCVPIALIFAHCRAIID
jgi:hypothetical protein